MALTPTHPLRFLALCARPEIDEELRCRLAMEATGLETWDLVVVAAEYHEIAGLLAAHLQAADVQLPTQARRTLAGFVARTRHATHTRLQVLAEVLETFNTQGIETLVLKGGALALTLYREPAHRPLADLDLWVAPERIEEAQACLLRQGFVAHPAHGLPGHRHLPPVSRELDGIRVMVELHSTVVAGGSKDPAALLDRSSAFEVGGQPARTLGPADMLAQLHQHLIYHLLFHRHLRLKWVADLIGLAERHAQTIDWAELRTLYPAMPGALAMLHLLSPLSARTRNATGISTRPVRASRDRRGDLCNPRTAEEWLRWGRSRHPGEARLAGPGRASQPDRHALPRRLAAATVLGPRSARGPVRLSVAIPLQGDRLRRRDLEEPRRLLGDTQPATLDSIQAAADAASG